MSGFDRSRRFVAIMKDSGLSRRPIDSFCAHFETLVRGGTGMFREDRIEPVSGLRDAGTFDGHARQGKALLARTVVIKLNGGLGTGMGLVKPKSLIEVRNGLTFLDLIARQTLWLRREHGVQIPLLLMNSAHTRRDSLKVLRSYTGLELDGLPLDFLQHRVPKVECETYNPASFPTDPEMEWCPAGHGDIYCALAASGTLDQLLANGIEYAFISNADNLGATIDPRILGFMAENNIDFMMEAADRTESDRKGGHLCSIDGDRLALRELAQCPPDERQGFQDVSRFCYFNTNNLWVHLPSLSSLLGKHRGVLPLAPIFNRKTVDPRDPESTPVIHIETAMGAAISLFSNAAAVRVPRHRFSPVKSTNDLLAIRSDAYLLTSDCRIIEKSTRSTPPLISLDPRYFKLLENFDARFSNGPPSLKDCVSLNVEGDIAFGGGVTVKGEVHISSADGPATVPDGATLSGSVTL